MKTFLVHKYSCTCQICTPTTHAVPGLEEVLHTCSPRLSFHFCLVSLPLQYLWPVPCLFLWPRGLILPQGLERAADESECTCARSEADLERGHDCWLRSTCEPADCAEWLRFHLKSPCSGTAGRAGAGGVDRPTGGQGWSRTMWDAGRTHGRFPKSWACMLCSLYTY